MILTRPQRSTGDRQGGCQVTGWMSALSLSCPLSHLHPYCDKKKMDTQTWAKIKTDASERLCSSQAISLGGTHSLPPSTFSKLPTVPLLFLVCVWGGGTSVSSRFLISAPAASAPSSSACPCSLALCVPSLCRGFHGSPWSCPAGSQVFLFSAGARVMVL